MSDQIKSEILKYMKGDNQREYTIPDIQSGIQIRNREHIAVALRELELEGLVTRPRSLLVGFFKRESFN